jgi:membrane protein DedA with SNARE-associated domain
VLERLLDALASLPLVPTYLVLMALSALENVFPPIPADTAAALGAFLASAGTGSATAVFLVTWLANVAGAAGVYFAARRLGRPFLRGPLGRRMLDPRTMARIERLHDRWGLAGIFLSRFIPGVRSIVPPFAAVAGVSPVRALAPLALASGLWFGVVTWAIVTFAQEVRDVVRFVDRMNEWTAALAIAAVLAIVTVLRFRLRRPVRLDRLDPR